MHANKYLLLISNKNDPITLSLNHVWDEYILKWLYISEEYIKKILSTLSLHLFLCGI